MTTSPEIIILGPVATLSHRKARKLAYRYRGSRLGQRYRDFLAGHCPKFYPCKNRLRRRIAFNPVAAMTAHSADAAERLSKMLASLLPTAPGSFSIEDPVEMRLSAQPAST